MKDIGKIVGMVPVMAGLVGSLLTGDIASAQQIKIDRTKAQLLAGRLLLHGNTPGQVIAGELLYLSGLIDYQRELMGVGNPQTNTYVSNRTRGTVYFPPPATGRIKKVSIGLDEQGMSIYTNFRIENGMGSNAQLIAYFYDTWTGRPLQDSDGIYSSVDNQVSVGSMVFSPPYQNTRYENFAMFIPWDQIELHSATKHSYGIDYKMQVALFTVNSNNHTRRLHKSKWTTLTQKKRK